jgi:myo-inositol-1(or 4)-monophosphatase
MEKIDYVGILPAATKAARQAGDFLLNGLPQAKNVDFKGEVDLVTTFDRQSEEMIFNELSAQFPTYNFLAEENIRQDNHSDFSWIVDPLDGTTNFAHGLPIFGVINCLAFKGRVVAGCRL